jgi:hypothetical protein
MFVTLRKAAQILSEIEKWKKSNIINLYTTVEVVDVSDLSVDKYSLLEKNKKTLDLINNHTNLIGVTFSIRGAIAEKNFVIGITDRLNKLASIEAKLKILGSLFDNIEPNKDNLSNVALLYRKIAGKDKQAYGGSSFSTSLLLEKDVKEIKSAHYNLKKIKNELSDEILGLNTNNKIEISEEDYNVLVKLEIV